MSFRRELRELFTKSDESVVINFVAAAFPNDAVKRESWTTLFCAYALRSPGPGTVSFSLNFSTNSHLETYVVVANQG